MLLKDKIEIERWLCEHRIFKCELIEDIDKWDDLFQSTYNKLDPVTSGFSNSLEEKNVFSQSELLKQRLITELSCDYQVE